MYGNIDGQTRVISISIYDNVEQPSYQNAHVLSLFRYYFLPLYCLSYILLITNAIGLNREVYKC